MSFISAHNSPSCPCIARRTEAWKRREVWPSSRPSTTTTSRVKDISTQGEDSKRERRERREGGERGEREERKERETVWIQKEGKWEKIYQKGPGRGKERQRRGGVSSAGQKEKDREAVSLDFVTF